MLEPTAIDGVFILTPSCFRDDRGWLMETWSDARWGDLLGGVVFVQDNHSYSARVHTVRGLHLQIAPWAQDKLVRVVRGSALDVAVDLRPGSATFGQHVAVELSAENRRQLFIPKGFAHGFMTLRDDTEVMYKISGTYAVQAERGLLWHDPALGIDWPAGPDQVVVSTKDMGLPTLENALAEGSWLTAGLRT